MAASEDMLWPRDSADRCSESFSSVLYSVLVPQLIGTIYIKHLYIGFTFVCFTYLKNIRSAGLFQTIIIIIILEWII